MIRPDYSEHQKPDGCFPFWLCLIVLAWAGVLLFTSDYWPQAAIAIMLALAILLKRS